MSQDQRLSEQLQQLIAEVRRRRAADIALGDLVAACEELNHGSPRDVDDTIAGIQAALKRVHEIMPGGRHGQER
jgi:hypothetical protein